MDLGEFDHEYGDESDEEEEEEGGEESAEEEVDNDAWYCISATSATLYSDFSGWFANNVISSVYSDNIDPKVFKCFSLLDSSRAM